MLHTCDISTNHHQWDDALENMSAFLQCDKWLWNRKCGIILSTYYFRAYSYNIGFYDEQNFLRMMKPAWIGKNCILCDAPFSIWSILKGCLHGRICSSQLLNTIFVLKINNRHSRKSNNICLVNFQRIKRWFYTFLNDG